MNFLSGYKTHIGMIAAGIYGVVIQAEWATAEQIGWLLPIILAWTGVSIKHAIDKRGG